MARRKYNKKTGNIAVLIFALAFMPIALLYQAFGDRYFWIAVIGALLVMLAIKWAARRDLKSTQTNQVNTETSNSEQCYSDPDSAWFEYCRSIENAWQRGDYDWARQALQKIAYSMVGKSVTQEQKNQFTHLMKTFAIEDPMYREIISIALPYITANPGTLQSKIYTQLPNWTKEEVRYALYFANEIGHIHRIKKGNSYKLMPPGHTLESVLVDK